MAVIVGGVLVMLLLLAMSVAMLRWVEITLHPVAACVAPLLLAVLEMVLVVCWVPETQLLAYEWRWPVAGMLLAAVLCLHGGLSAYLWWQHYGRFRYAKDA